jgi:hypothetical protein
VQGLDSVDPVEKVQRKHFDIDPTICEYQTCNSTLSIYYAILHVGSFVGLVICRAMRLDVVPCSKSERLYRVLAGKR